MIETNTNSVASNTDRFTDKNGTAMVFDLTLKITFIGLVFIVLHCGALIIEKDTRFVNRKCVGTSRMTLQQYSKIKCVQKCHEENTKGLCNVAGYNKATKTCYLSMDSHQDVLDVADDMSGVYFMEKGTVNLNTLKFNFELLNARCTWAFLKCTF